MTHPIVRVRVKPGEDVIKRLNAQMDEQMASLFLDGASSERKSSQGE